MFYAIYFDFWPPKGIAMLSENGNKNGDTFADVFDIKINAFHSSMLRKHINRNPYSPSSSALVHLSPILTI
jgi:hypothetical protein